MKRQIKLPVLITCASSVLNGGIIAVLLLLNNTFIALIAALVFLIANTVLILKFAFSLSAEVLKDVNSISTHVYKPDYEIDKSSLLASFEEIRRPLLSTLGALNGFNSEIRANSDVLENTFEYFVKVINEILHAIGQIEGDMSRQKDAVNTTSSAVVQMISSVDSVTASTKTQASSVIGLSSTLEEMTASINTIVATAQKANDISDQLLKEAVKGNESINDTIKSINDIQGSSNQISEIVSVISNISNQTNLLAMNAAIEAAHAGEAGKGFAVVADEIRKLAENSNSSAKQIEDLIKDVTNKIQVSVVNGQSIAEVFNSILGDIERTQNIVAEITKSIEEQSVGTNEIFQATQNLMKITDDIKSSMNEQHDSNKEMNAVVANLEGIAEHVMEITEETQKKRFLLLDAVNRLGKVSVRNYDVSERLEKLLDQNSMIK